PVVLAGRSDFWLQGRDLRDAVAEIGDAASGGVQLERPWAVPDNNEPATGWIDDLYRPITAASMLRDIRFAALSIYEALVREWFPTMMNLFETSATLPACNVFLYQPCDQTHPATTWSEWYPLPHLKAAGSRVAAAIMESLPPRWMSESGWVK